MLFSLYKNQCKSLYTNTIHNIPKLLTQLSVLIVRQFVKHSGVV